MAYLIAKDPEKHGCYGIQVEHGKKLVELKRELNRTYNGIEFMTISRPEAYGEYAPYQILETEEEFLVAVKNMRK